MAHPNEELLRQGYGAFATGDIETLTAGWADDIEWIVKGEPFEGTYRGRDEVLGFLGRLAELTDGTMRVDVRRMLADDDCVAVLIDSEATIGGTQERSSGVHVFEFSDGKICRARFYWEDPSSNEAMAREAERRLAAAT